MAHFAENPLESTFEFEPIRLMLLIILTDASSHRGISDDFPLFDVIENMHPNSMSAERWESTNRRWYG